MKKPLFLIFNDIHLKEDNLETIIDVMGQGFNYANENGITNLICLGDVFESRKSQRLNILLSFRSILNTIPERMHLYCTVGNHEKTDYSKKESFLDVFSNHPRFTLFDDADSCDFLGGKYKVTFLPYFSEKEYIERLNNIKDKKGILFTHTAFHGSMNNDGEEVECTIKPSLFKDFDIVLSGHYHNLQDIKPNIYHLPSLIQHNFGEDNIKGFTILYDDLSQDIFKPKFKEYVNIKLDVDKLSKKDLEKLISEHSNSESNVRFTLTGSEDKLKGIDKEKLNAVGIDVKKKTKEIETIDVEQTKDIKKFDLKAIEQEFVEFCKLKGYNHKEGEIYLKIK